MFAATFGYAFAVNDTLSIKTAVAASFTGDTDFDLATLRPQEQFSLRFGLTPLATRNLYIEPSVSFNLGDSNSSVTFGVNLPYTFRP